MATAARPSNVEAALAALTKYRQDPREWSVRCYQILDKFGVLRPFVWNRVQQDLYRREQLQFKKKGRARQYALKARQGGITTYAQSRNLHMAWGTPGSAALTLAHDRDTTDKIFAITTRAIEHFPPELLPNLGEAQTREITFPGLDSRFYTGTAGANKGKKKGRARTGRGLTLWRLHGSEFAFWDNPRSTLTSASGSLVPRGSAVLLETTASGAGSDAHEFWLESKEGGTGYECLFYPWWETDFENYRTPLDEPDELFPLDDEEQLLVRRFALTLDQIKWRRLQMKEMQRAEFLQEYPEDDDTCWINAGGMFYDAEELKRLRLMTPTPKATLDNGHFLIYNELPPGERAIGGVDTAEGVNKDRNTAIIRSFPSWTLLAKYSNNRIAPEGFADFLAGISPQYRMPLWVIEKNMHGITVIRRMRDKHEYPIERMYHRMTQARNEPRPRKELGWYTGGETTPLLLDGGRLLITAALEGRATPPDKEALSDAFKVQRDPDTGKVKMTGRDVWMAELLAWQGRMHPLRGAPLIVGSSSMVTG